MAMKESRFARNKECTVDLSVDKLETNGKQNASRKPSEIGCPYRDAIPKATRSDNRMWWVSN